MNKRMTGILLAGVLLFGTALPVQADVLEGKEGWNVTFTSGSRLESNFKTANMNEEISNMQPGDTVILTMKLQNQNGNVTDWYMTNKVLQSLEDNSPAGAKGGAYTYRLSYQTAAGTSTVLYDSEKVGGEEMPGAAEDENTGGNEDENTGGNENGGQAAGGVAGISRANDGNTVNDGTPEGTNPGVTEGGEVSDDTVSGNTVSDNNRLGLREATSSLEEYFHIDTMNGGQYGIVTLEIMLDGETQGNDYQETLADLTMNFAVEKRPSPQDRHRSPREVIKRLGEFLEDDPVPLSGSRTSSTVRTSDDNRLILFTVLTLVSGAALLLLSVYCRKAGEKEGK